MAYLTTARRAVSAAACGCFPLPRIPALVARDAGSESHGDGRFLFSSPLKPLRCSSQVYVLCVFLGVAADGQGVDARRDHRLRQVPTAPSQGAEHEPVRWRRCRRAARGRHVLGVPRLMVTATHSGSRATSEMAQLPLVVVVQLLLLGRGSAANGGAPAAAAAAGSDSLTVTEQQVAKLMVEDMGTAMQYLQGKGLCLMPISLASAISTATCHLRPPVVAAAAQHIPAGLGAAHHHHQLSAAAAAMRHLPGLNADGSVPASPSMSVLTAQSAMANGGGGADGEGSQPKDAASVSNP